MEYSDPDQAANSKGGLLHQINHANRVDHMKSYVQDLISENKYLRANKINSKNIGQGNGIETNPNDIENVVTLNPEDAVTVAFAVSVTGCGSDPLTEGAAVLKHSIHRASVRGTMGGRYNYKMYAIYHPQAEACAKTLEALGYELLQRDTFVKVSDIKGEFLRTNIEKNGCWCVLW